MQKKKMYVAIGIIAFMLVLITIKSITSIKKEAPVHYVRNLPGSIMAMTVPPLGIFIEEKYSTEGSLPGTILAHERIHWLQYQERGLFKFYWEYLGGWLKDGRLYNKLEEDARERSASN